MDKKLMWYSDLKRISRQSQFVRKGCKRNVNKILETAMSQKLIRLSLKPRHILDLNPQEKRQFLDSFDISLSDCDGVIWYVTGPIPNAGAAVNLLNEAGKQIKFISNNGMRTDEEYLYNIQKLGVKLVEKNDIIMPAKVAANYIRKHYPNETCYCLAGDPFCRTLEQMGIKVENLSRAGFTKMEDFSKAVTPPKEAKIAALDINFYQTYADYTLAHQFLVKPDCQLFITATDMLIPMNETLTVIGPGVFVNAFVNISEKKPIMCGKPSILMAKYMTEKYRIEDHSRALFIGDNLSIDVKYARTHGFQSLFVCSGVNTIEDMWALPFEDQPDYYADSLGDFVEFFKDLET